jgi:hypothetical protein
MKNASGGFGLLVFALTLLGVGVAYFVSTIFFVGQQPTMVFIVICVATAVAMTVLTRKHTR